MNLDCFLWPEFGYAVLCVGGALRNVVPELEVD